MRHRRRAAAIALVTAIVGCEQTERLSDAFRDLTPYEAYRASLGAAGLAETALGRDWIRAGEVAIEGAAPVSLPFSEEGFITAEEPSAMAYRLSLPRGQRLTADVELTGAEGTRLFVDLFRVPQDPEAQPRPVLSTDSLPGSFVHEPWRGGEYILRVQPELLRGGRYRVTLRLEAQLAFPVEGHGMPAVWSVFGVERDGGRRSHDGVDIFAPRGTPVLASSAGWAEGIEITNLGGKVVWVRDPVRNSRIYYAHLDSQAVADGDRIEVGDTLGFVGNTGNARTTPPHLHFGVYRSGEGPVDPTPFIRPVQGSVPELTADLDRLGSWVRLRNDGIRLRSAPGLRAPVVRELPRYTALRVVGGAGEYFRVRLPDGESGYVAARLTEDANQPFSSQVATSGERVRARPVDASPVLAMVDAETELPVLGTYGRFLYVQAPDGHLGWLDAATTEE